jgi:hypothetical protein
MVCWWYVGGTLQDVDRDPPFTDIASSPFAGRPVLIHSAWVKFRDVEWKWKELCLKPEIREARKKKGWACKPLTADEVKEKQAFEKERKEKNKYTRKREKQELDSE